MNLCGCEHVCPALAEALHVCLRQSPRFEPKTVACPSVSGLGSASSGSVQQGERDFKCAIFWFLELSRRRPPPPRTPPEGPPRRPSPAPLPASSPVSSPVPPVSPPTPSSMPSPMPSLMPLSMPSLALPYVPPKVAAMAPLRSWHRPPVGAAGRGARGSGRSQQRASPRARSPRRAGGRAGPAGARRAGRGRRCLPGESVRRWSA